VPPGPDPGAAPDAGGAPDRDTMVAELAALGEDPAALDAMSDDDLAALYQERKGTAMSEHDDDPLPGEGEEEELLEEEVPPVPPTPTPPAPAPARRPVPKQITRTVKFSERDYEVMRGEVRRLVRAESEAFRKEAAALRQAERGRAEAERRGRVRAFCELQLKEGRVAPWEMDESDPRVPSLVERLLLLDARTPVRKFSEAGKPPVTALDLEMRAIEARPARRYSEKVPGGGGNAALTPEERARALSYTGTGQGVLDRERAARAPRN
jgi:hypothetical protein